MGLEAILGMLGGGSANLPLSPNAPSLDALTLNPSVMGDSPQIPYAAGPPQTYGEPTPPESPPGGNPKKKTWQDQIGDLGKVLQSASKTGKAIGDSVLAQRMFQESSQKQMMQNQINQGKMEEFRRHDLSSQILEKYGLL
jgi:hypothetical protein